jgi:kdpB: K+-transporting ATPase, B subunit
MTRGTLTTFSIANDVAKYFAIVPALFMLSIPELAALNIMGLHSPESAILSAVIFNASHYSYSDSAGIERSSIQTDRSFRLASS